MVSDLLVSRARALWVDCARAPVGFPAGGGDDGDGWVTVVVSPGSVMCPAGWVGLVVVGRSAIVSVPDETCGVLVRSALRGMSVGEVVEGRAVLEALMPGDVLGPTVLAYVDAELFRPVDPGAVVVEQLPGDHRDLAALEREAGAEDAGEAAITEVTSPAFVVREAGRVVAACGYRLWPCRVAHVSVLTAPDARGRGLAKVAGSAAVRHALDAGLTPQWRARVPASRRVARALGFCEVGTQLSFRIPG